MLKKLKSVSYHTSPATLFVFACIFTFTLIYAVKTNFLIIDADIFWHTASGRWIVEHGQLPANDPFLSIAASVTNDRTWVCHFWLTDVLFFYTQSYFNWIGITVLTCFCFALAMMILMRYLERYLRTSAALLLTLFSMGILITHLIARPHIIILPLLVIWVGECVKARDEQRAPPFWLLVIYFFWINLHGIEGIPGFVIAMAFAFEAFIDAKSTKQQLKVIKTWGLFLILALLVSLFLSPVGVATWQYFIAFFKFSHMQFIAEFNPPVLANLFILEIWLAVILFIALSKKLYVPLYRLLMLLGILFLTINSYYVVNYFAILSAFLLAPPLQQAFAPRLDPTPNKTTHPALFWVMMLAITLYTLAFSGWMVKHHATLPDNLSTAPYKAINFAKTAQLTGPLFNEEVFNGYLALAGFQPFIDDKVELYNQDFAKAYFCATTHGGIFLTNLLQHYQINWVILSPYTAAAVTTLETDKNWKLLYADKLAVIFQRITPYPDSPPMKSIARCKLSD
ncbi:hypothetical protein Lste_0871 [Legionella steelei]|uniref:Transmembrane protein n=1 Tax=Legionella steelei TaxID=947033 RepID=A0A0W0ZF10_9GAMM|nr:hypothetical protein [Legionella steelei]KTD67713.1 hypothetical protein Lste_0871 [Legionella steelei]